MEEDGMSGDEQEDAEEELSSEADTPEVGCNHALAAGINKVHPQASVLSTFVSRKVLDASQMFLHTCLCTARCLVTR